MITTKRHCFIVDWKLVKRLSAWKLLAVQLQTCWVFFRMENGEIGPRIHVKDRPELFFPHMTPFLAPVVTTATTEAFRWTSSFNRSPNIPKYLHTYNSRGVALTQQTPVCAQGKLSSAEKSAGLWGGNKTKNVLPSFRWALYATRYVSFHPQDEMKKHFEMLNHSNVFISFS